jgi:hypothetical protein
MRYHQAEKRCDKQFELLLDFSLIVVLNHQFYISIIDR